jgi:hypothetical protein
MSAATIHTLYDKWQAGATEDERQEDLFGTAAPIWIEDADWSEVDIPIRPWLAKGYMMRGAVTVVSGPGSAGKSSLMIGWCLAIVLGIKWHKLMPTGPLRVITYNTEDDAAEQRRRMSATLRQFDRSPRDLGTNLIRIGPNATGTLLRRDPMSGRLVFTAAMKALETQITEQKPDVLILDPLVELHDAEENDNTALRAVMAKFRSLAVEHNMSVVLLHHARKGSGQAAGDPDSLRGASSIVGAARIVLTVLTMDGEQAAKLGIPSEEKGRYFRVDGAKSNYAPLHEAEWFERVEYELDNGEKVAAAQPWEPPSVFGDATGATLNAVLDQIAAGPQPGHMFTPTKRGGSDRWCGQVVMDALDMDEPQAKQIIGRWFKSGLLVQTKYHHPELRREVPGVVVDSSKRPN